MTRATPIFSIHEPQPAFIRSALAVEVGLEAVK